MIGDEDILSDIPKLIYVKKKPWILTKDVDNNPILYDAICSHFGGVVSNLKKDVWVCPSHLWKYDPSTGKCITAPSRDLKSYPVTIKNEQLVVDLPIKFIAQNRLKSEPKIPPKITVPCASGLLFEWKGFNIFCDPWMGGTCMQGSWLNYPPPMDIHDLPKIDAIWISHEHSDHFHEPTLLQFDKNIPIYVAKFDDGHLVSRIKKLGFKNIIQVKTGESILITDDIQLISFKSASIWNDSISYWKFGNFAVLNVNDSGFNWKIQDRVGKIDVLCLQFTGPTSGYPLTWTHIDESEKKRIQIAANNGILNMMKTVADVCQAEYILPFAGFWEFGHPELRKDNPIIFRNSISQVIKYFKHTKFKVLDLIPGESWDGKFVRVLNREKFFDESYKDEYIKEKYEIESKQETKIRIDINQIELKEYFEAFSGTKPTKYVGYYRIFFTTNTENGLLKALITFNDGKITYEPVSDAQNAELTMSIPGRIVQEIIRKDLSWDEAFNGAWGTFSRDPDIYNIHLWKLLHAPWIARTDYVKQKDLEYNLNPLTISIADLIEKGGYKVSKTFEKYGLFCTGCEQGIGETVEEGCGFHGLSKKKTKELIDELESFNLN